MHNENTRGKSFGNPQGRQHTHANEYFMWRLREQRGREERHSVGGISWWEERKGKKIKILGEIVWVN